MPSRYNSFLRFSSMAFQMGVPIFLGIWGGMKLDQKFTNSFHGFTIGLSLLGVGVSLYLVIKDLSR
ncbi:MAG: AtpZ/AtpI family protein [Flavobacteriales bacterium]|nr:AtpZ/AtpI family protein [Flavobacteriales bacterium]